MQQFKFQDFNDIYFLYFSLITKQLRMPMEQVQTSTFFCFCYSLVALFILAFAPSINSANIQITSNIPRYLVYWEFETYDVWHFRQAA